MEWYRKSDGECVCCEKRPQGQGRIRALADRVGAGVQLQAH
jgi:hypothetical protein